MTRRGVLLFAAMCVIWGIPYLLIRVAVRELTPVMLVFARTGIAALLLVPVAAWRGELRLARRHWVPLIVFTVIEIMLPWLLLAHAETRLTSSLTGLLIAAVPLVGALVTTFTGERERHGARRWTGLLVGIAGVAAIVGLDVRGAGVLPLLEIAVVAVSYAVGPIVLARWLSDAPSLGVVAASLAIAAVGYAPFAAFSLPSRLPGWKVNASVVTLAVVCTAARLRPLLPADRGDGAGARDGDHLRQPGSRRGARRHGSERTVHRRDGDRLRARAQRIRARDPRNTGTAPTALPFAACHACRRCCWPRCWLC